MELTALLLLPLAVRTPEGPQKMEPPLAWSTLKPAGIGLWVGVTGKLPTATVMLPPLNPVTCRLIPELLLKEMLPCALSELNN